MQITRGADRLVSSRLSRLAHCTVRCAESNVRMDMYECAARISRAGFHVADATPWLALHCICAASPLL